MTTKEHQTRMAEFSAQDVKALRDRTGAGFMDCKRALEEAGGDIDKATGILRERGLAAAAKKSGREAREGLISSYIHTGGRVGVLIEVNCETDFVARTEEFQKLVRDLAVQVAGLAPQWVTREDVPEEAIEAKRRELAEDPRPRRHRVERQPLAQGERPLRAAVPRLEYGRSGPHPRTGSRPSARTSSSGGSRVTPSVRSCERRPIGDWPRPGRRRAPLPAHPPEAVR